MLLMAVCPVTLGAQGRSRTQEVAGVLAPLVERYGVSGMGEPTVVFVAHLDEIGFRITAIRDDGSLELSPVGGLFPSLWEAKPALVHTGGRPEVGRAQV